MKTINVNGKEAKVNVSMKRCSSYGQYIILSDIRFSGDSIYRKNEEVAYHSTDSQLWDDEEKTEDVLFNIIEDRLISKIEEIIEDREEEKN